MNIWALVKTVEGHFYSVLMVGSLQAVRAEGVRRDAEKEQAIRDGKYGYADISHRVVRVGDE